MWATSKLPRIECLAWTHIFHRIAAIAYLLVFVLLNSRKRTKIIWFPAALVTSYTPHYRADTDITATTAYTAIVMANEGKKKLFFNKILFHFESSCSELILLGCEKRTHNKNQTEYSTWQNDKRTSCCVNVRKKINACTSLVRRRFFVSEQKSEEVCTKMVNLRF